MPGRAAAGMHQVPMQGGTAGREREWRQSMLLANYTLSSYKDQAVAQRLGLCVSGVKK